VIYQKDPKAFTDREIDLLTSFANHAAMAIENATLFERSDAALQEQTRRLEALIQSFEDGLVLEDLNGHVLYINRRMSDYARKHPEEILGSPVEALFKTILEDAKDREEKLHEVELTLRNGSQNGGVEIDLRRPSGMRHLRLRAFTVTDSSGLPIGRGQILRDTTKDYEVDRMKSSLISIASHELRTPLAAIKGYASTLLARDVTWDLDAQREFLEVISAEADHLSELVDNLMDMSRIESGSLIISPKLCEIDALVSEALSRCYPHPGQRLDVEKTTGRSKIFADKPRLVVVIRNLVENATKYSDDGSPIRLTIEEREDEFVFRVQDSGQGIPPEKHEKVFDSFYRLDNDQTRKNAGAGLGLAICRGFVMAHGGRIWLEPAEKGTNIAFTIPFESVAKHRPDTGDSHLAQREPAEVIDR
jgi:signal transduction histidine kinase